MKRRATASMVRCPGWALSLAPGTWPREIPPPLLNKRTAPTDAAWLIEPEYLPALRALYDAQEADRAAAKIGPRRLAEGLARLHELMDPAADLAA